MPYFFNLQFFIPFLRFELFFRNFWSNACGFQHKYVVVVFANFVFHLFLKLWIHLTEERLAGALVRLGGQNTEGQAPTNDVCGEIKRKDIDNNSVLELECNTKGRYLSVNLPGKNYLTLCEVKIYGGECNNEGI